MSTSNKFELRRNSYRRTYGYKRMPKVPTTFIDPNTGKLVTRDFNTVDRVYNYYRVNGQNPLTDAFFALYEENLITFVGTDTQTINFTNAFSATPIVTVDVYPTGTVFVNPYITAVNNTSLTVGLSAPISGTIRYKALDASQLIDVFYPISVERIPLFPGLSTHLVAGQVSLTNANQATIDYTPYVSASIAPPEVTFALLSDVNSDTYIDPNGTTTVYGLTASLTSVVASNTLNYIAMVPSGSV